MDIDKARRKLYARKNNVQLIPPTKASLKNISKGQYIKVDMCGVRYCCQHQNSHHQPTGAGQ
ncbi:uncharacterized protein LOC103506659 [Caligus rogercresseyi]|uniref:Uncharacterized protein LOC103506659 n=1 Tax=Caligus rogercresseyi TaxID=217165 RepID=A0A7T8KF54_CALRO|nr:uncharacterized protein LOC103506659 [Caligus rogercresseyi]